MRKNKKNKKKIEISGAEFMRASPRKINRHLFRMQLSLFCAAVPIWAPPLSNRYWYQAMPPPTNASIHDIESDNIGN